MKEEGHVFPVRASAHQCRPCPLAADVVAAHLAVPAALLPRPPAKSDDCPSQMPPPTPPTLLRRLPVCQHIMLMPPSDASHQRRTIYAGRDDGR